MEGYTNCRWCGTSWRAEAADSLRRHEASCWSLVACPRCGAAAGDPCTYPSGQVIGAAHGEREDSAARAPDPSRVNNVSGQHI